MSNHRQHVAEIVGRITALAAIASETFAWLDSDAWQRHRASSLGVGVVSSIYDAKPTEDDQAAKAEQRRKANQLKRDLAWLADVKLPEIIKRARLFDELETPGDRARKADLEDTISAYPGRGGRSVPAVHADAYAAQQRRLDRNEGYGDG